MGGDDDGLVGLTDPRHSSPEQAPGHRGHASGWLIQKGDHRLSQQDNASAQLLLAATSRSREEEGLGERQLSTSSSPPLPAFSSLSRKCSQPLVGLLVTVHAEYKPFP